MAFGLPFNLVSMTAVLSQPNTQVTLHADSTRATTVQPSTSGTGTQGAASDGAHNRNQSGATDWPRMPRAQTSLTVTPDRAASKSVINAQIHLRQPTQTAHPQAKFDSLGITPATDYVMTDLPRKVDRYAPPDPLPTAPILRHIGLAVPTLKRD